MWIGSADLMPRNLDRRVEVLAPVEDARLRARIAAALDALLSDTRFAWDARRGRQVEPSRHRPPGEAPVSAQELLMAARAQACEEAPLTALQAANHPVRTMEPRRAAAIVGATACVRVRLEG